MFRYCFGVLTLALFPAVAAAQICGTTDLTETFTDEENAYLAARVAGQPFSEGLLWQAEKDGSRVVVAGTLHIPDRRFDPIVAQLTPEIESSDLLILEATRDAEVAMAQAAATNPEMFFLTSGPSLIDLLEPAEWDQVSAELAKRGIPGVIAAKFQPWYASLVMATPICALSAMQAGEAGLDRRLETVAEAAGVDVAGLEGIEAVLDVFSGETIEDQLEGLRINLSVKDDEDANTSTLVELYFQGRTRESWEVSRVLIDRQGIENGQEMFDEVEESLLIGRNEDWEPIMNELIAGRDAVMAVGAAHLSGETGVLRALERAGYEVTPF